MERRIAFVLNVLVSCLTIITSCFADSVYKWTDATGKIHYSTKPPNDKVKPIDLPRITRAEVKLPSTKLQSCQDHGDIDCQAGSDTDGSVICHDGFREAAARYRFTCNSPKLEIADLSDVNPDGSFSVFVRNTKGIAANNLALLFKTKERSELKLTGPETIEAYGVAEFTYNPKTLGALKAKPRKAQLKVTCSNCP